MAPQGDSLQTIYTGRFAGMETYRNEVWKVLCADFFSGYVPEQSIVLDIGAGWGEFINNIHAAGKIAMDLNPDTGSRLAPGIRLIRQDCSVAWPLEDNSLDVVFTSNFLEHLPDKESIHRTVTEAFRCLKNDGRIICLGPNIRYLPGSYWDFWDHIIPLSDSSCCELLKTVGFSIDRSVARFLPYTMSATRKPPLALVRMYCRLPLLWPIFGKQFLVIGRKAAAPDRSRAT